MSNFRYRNFHFSSISIGAALCYFDVPCSHKSQFHLPILSFTPLLLHLFLYNKDVCVSAIIYNSLKATFLFLLHLYLISLVNEEIFWTEKWFCVQIIKTCLKFSPKTDKFFPSNRMAPALNHSLISTSLSIFPFQQTDDVHAKDNTRPGANSPGELKN